MKRILLISVILAAMLLIACGTPNATPETDTTPAPTPATVESTPEPPTTTEPAPTPTEVTPTTEPSQPAYELQLLSASHERAYDYITMSGEVKNISSKNLENVMVVVSYYTDDNTFVKSDDALIDYNPILPGQTSPFESITTDNPAIKRFKITFKFMFGGTILTEDMRK